MLNVRSELKRFTTTAQILPGSADGGMRDDTLRPK